MPEMSRFEKSLVNRRGERSFRGLLDQIDRERVLDLPAGAAILELGTGNGTLSRLLYERYRPSRICATDYDPEQVAVAKRNVERRYGSLPPGFTAERVDACRMEYPDASFDLVVAHLMLHHVGSVVEEQQAIREITRVLRPGGRLLYVEMLRKKVIREELARLRYRVLFCVRSFRFFGFAESVVALSPALSGQPSLSAPNGPETRGFPATA